MKPQYTPEQLAALNAQGKVIVSASAGSGKTTVMIERIIRLICDNTRVEEILAVTFTKKAAAQMKEKLAKELIKVINDPDTNEAKCKELKQRLIEVPSADISTIHSFCSKLLRRHFFAAGIDNSFRVISGDDADGTVLKNEALDELFDEGYEQQNADFMHLLSVYWRKKSDKTFRNILLSTYEELRNRDDYRAYLQQSGAFDEETFQKVCDDLLQLLKEKCRYYIGLLQVEKEYFEGIGAASQTSLASELIEGLQEIEKSKDYFSACALQKPKYTVNRSSKSDSDEKRSHINRLAYLKGKVVKIYEDELEKTSSEQEEKERFLCSGETARALSACLLRFDEKYAEKKAENGVLDYNDLEHKTLELLRNEEVVAEIKAKYKYVFVDEYQDVNPVQEKIISMLSGENLFLVGDVKQSIYGFRGSKSKFFVEKQKEFACGGGHSLPLTRNFRSADAVLDAVNQQFSLAMTPEVCGVDYNADSRMERGGRYALNSGKVQIHFLGEEEKKPKTERGIYSVRENANKKETEESLSAKLIHSIIEKELNSEIYDPESNEENKMRRVRYADIAILSRKKQGQIGKTVAALADKQLPVTAAAAVSICEFSEIKTLIDILSLIDNAQQDVPLCSALLSTMGNLTADELTEIRLAYPETHFFRHAVEAYANEKTDALATKLQKFYAYYQEIRTLSRVLSAGEILTKLLSDTRMETQLLSRANGVACMRRIHRFIEETSVEEPLTVHAFLNRLRDLDYKIECNENGGEDSVKVYTMHSSKGLEYPIVILDNLSAPFRGVDHAEVYVEERYGLATRAFSQDKMLKNTTLLRRLHELKEQKSSLADELNLYYVALTRAQHTLHMVFNERTPIANPLYAHSFAEFTDFSVWKEYIVEDEIFDLPKQERPPIAYHPNEELSKGIREAFLWQYPYACCADIPVKSSATGLMKGQEQNVEPISFGISLTDTEEEWKEGEADVSSPMLPGESVEKGLAYHAFLECFDFSLLQRNGKPITANELSALVRETLGALQKENVQRYGLVEENQAVEILQNPVFYQLNDMRLYKEQQFLVSLPVRDTYAKREDIRDLRNALEEEIIFQGAIDLLAVKDGEARIIDYKYSRLSAEKLQKKYRLQLDLYKQAVAKILHIPLEKIHCSIVNICRGFQVEMD